MKKRFEKERLKKGIYILPNIFTTLNIFCGFYAIVAAIDGKYTAGAISILIAGIFDSLDGKIARATRTSSRFGVEYDSLADLVSFGMAPAVMMYMWALRPMGRIGWLAAFLFMVCGALRLARFNTQSDSMSGEYFQGLPIPAAAGMTAVSALFFQAMGIPGDAFPAVIMVMLYTLAFLMVSSIRYHSFKKKPELFKKMNFNALVIVVLGLIFIAAQPSVALFSMAVLYTLSGPFFLLWRHVRHKRPEKKKTGEGKPGPF